MCMQHQALVFWDRARAFPLSGCGQFEQMLVAMSTGCNPYRLLTETQKGLYLRQVCTCM